MIVTFDEARRVVEAQGFAVVPQPIYDRMRERCAEQDETPTRTPRLPREYKEIPPAVEALQSGRGYIE